MLDKNGLLGCSRVMAVFVEFGDIAVIMAAC